MSILRIFCFIFALAATVCATENQAKPKQWALLVAGSSGWENYGDQADVCHSYHTVRRHGIPEENIIVMIFDDVANDPQNPYPGTLINRINGSDVYKGVKKDYTGNDVTPENFLKVLRGDKMTVGSKRSIQSGPDDEVFVYFNDHGGPGVLAFPNDLLSVKDLTTTLTAMHHHKQYKKVVFFVDACYSGSMFEDQIPAEFNIYAQTAANADEDAYFCQMDDTLQTFVNSDFSYNWKVDADTENIQTERIQQEYKIVQNETSKSHVSEYGNLNIRKLDVSEFLGHKAATPIPYPPKVPCWSGGYTVNKNEAEYFGLRLKVNSAKNEQQKSEALSKINEANKKRRNAAQVIRKLVGTVLTQNSKQVTHFTVGEMIRRRRPIGNADCHHVLLKTFSNVCYPLSKNPYLLRFMNVLSNFCDAGFDEATLVDVLHQVCGNEVLDVNVV